MVLLSIVICLVYECIGCVCNGITTILCVLIIIKFTTVVVVLLAVTDDFKYGLQCDIIISQLDDIITVKIGFNCMIFDRICNDINTPLYTAIGIECMTAFAAFLPNVIRYELVHCVYRRNDQKTKGNVLFIFLFLNFVFFVGNGVKMWLCFFSCNC